MASRTRCVSFSPLNQFWVTFETPSSDNSYKERYVEFSLKKRKSSVKLFGKLGYCPLGKGIPFPKSFRSHPKTVDEIDEVSYLWSKLISDEKNETDFPTPGILQKFLWLEHKIYHLYDPDLSEAFEDQPEEFKKMTLAGEFQETLRKTYVEYERILTQRGFNLKQPHSLFETLQSETPRSTTH